MSLLYESYADTLRSMGLKYRITRCDAERTDIMITDLPEQFAVAPEAVIVPQWLEYKRALAVTLQLICHPKSKHVDIDCSAGAIISRFLETQDLINKGLL